MPVLSLPSKIKNILEKYYLLEENESLESIISNIEEDLLELEVRDIKTPKEFANRILNITKKHNFVENMNTGDDVKKIENLVKEIFGSSLKEQIFKTGLAIVRNTLRDLYDRRERKSKSPEEKQPEIVSVKKDTSKNLDNISKHLKINKSSFGVIHIDSLVEPEIYPKFLRLPNPELIKADLEQNGVNTTPIIIRPSEKEDGLYEIVYGLETYRYAKELGIKQLRATKIDIPSEEVLNYQKQLAQNFSPNAKDLAGDVSTPKQSNLASPEAKSTKKSKKRTIDIPNSTDIEGLKNYIERKSKSVRRGTPITFSAPSLKNSLQNATTPDGKNVFELVSNNQELKDKFASIYLGTNKEESLFEVFPEYEKKRQTQKVISTEPVSSKDQKTKKLKFPSTDLVKLKNLFYKEATTKRQDKTIVYKPSVVRKKLSSYVTSDNVNVYYLFATNQHLKDYFAYFYVGRGDREREKEFLSYFPEYSGMTKEEIRERIDSYNSNQEIPQTPKPQNVNVSEPKQKAAAPNIKTSPAEEPKPTAKKEVPTPTPEKPSTPPPVSKEPSTGSEDNKSTQRVSGGRRLANVSSTDIKKLKEVFDEIATESGGDWVFSPKVVKLELSNLVTSDGKNVFELFRTNDELKNYFASFYLNTPKESQFLKLFPEFANKGAAPQVKKPPKVEQPPKEVSKPVVSTSVDTSTNKTEQPIQIGRIPNKGVISDISSKDIEKLKLVFNRKVAGKLQGKLTVFKPETAKKRLSELFTSDGKNVFELFTTNEELKKYFASFYLNSPKEADFLKILPEFATKKNTVTPITKKSPEEISQIIQTAGTTKRDTEPETEEFSPDIKVDDNLIDGNINLDAEIPYDEFAVNKTTTASPEGFEDLEGEGESGYEEEEGEKSLIRPKVVGNIADEYIGDVKDLNKEQLKDFIDKELWDIRDELEDEQKVREVLDKEVNGTTLRNILSKNESLKKYFVGFFTGRVKDNKTIDKVKSIIDGSYISSPEPQEILEPISKQEENRLTSELEKDVLEKTVGGEEHEPQEVVDDIENKNLIKIIANKPYLIKKYENVFFSKDAYKEFVNLVADIISSRYGNQDKSEEIRQIVSLEDDFGAENTKPEQEKEFGLKATLNGIIDELNNKIKSDYNIKIGDYKERINSLNITKDMADDEVIEKLYTIYRIFQRYLEEKEKEIVRSAKEMTDFKNQIDYIESDIKREIFDRDIISKVRNELNITPKLDLDVVERADIESTIQELETLVNKLENSIGRKIRFTPIARTRYRNLISRLISIASNPETSKNLRKLDYERIETLLNQLLNLNTQHNNILKECIRLVYKERMKTIILNESKKYLKENIIASILRFIGQILGAFLEGFFGMFDSEKYRGYYRRYGLERYYDYDNPFYSDDISYIRREKDKIKKGLVEGEKEIAKVSEDIIEKIDEMTKKISEIEQKAREKQISPKDVTDAAVTFVAVENMEDNVSEYNIPKNIKNVILKIIFKLKEKTSKVLENLSKFGESVKNFIKSFVAKLRNAFSGKNDTDFENKIEDVILDSKEEFEEMSTDLTGTISDNYSSSPKTDSFSPDEDTEIETDIQNNNDTEKEIDSSTFIDNSLLKVINELNEDMINSDYLYKLSAVFKLLFAKVDIDEKNIKLCNTFLNLLEERKIFKDIETVKINKLNTAIKGYVSENKNTDSYKFILSHENALDEFVSDLNVNDPNEIIKNLQGYEKDPEMRQKIIEDFEKIFSKIKEMAPKLENPWLSTILQNIIDMSKIDNDIPEELFEQIKMTVKMIVPSGEERITVLGIEDVERFCEKIREDVENYLQNSKKDEEGKNDNDDEQNNEEENEEDKGNENKQDNENEVIFVDEEGNIEDEEYAQN